MCGVAEAGLGCFGQAECARFVARRGVDVDALFGRRCRLDRAEEAYRLLDARTTGKGVFPMRRRRGRD